MQPMTSKILTFAVALGVGSAMLPTPAAAQTGQDSAAETDAAPGDSDAAPEEAQRDGQPTGESAGQEDAEEGGDGSPAVDQQDQKDQQDSQAARDGGESSGAARGPGGRELRDDYPGTDEAMEEQMDTERIEGLEFQEGDQPAEAYDLKIKELETKIDDLKEKVFQSKSRVVLLKETVLGGNLSGSRAVIVHTSDLGGRFQLKRALYSLDGSRIYNEASDDGLPKEDLRIFDGSITAGNHNVSVMLEYQGNGFGLFNYMEGYNFKITSSCQFKAEEGKATILKVRTVNKGGAFTKVENKPGIKCQITSTDLSQEGMEGLADEQSEDGSDSNEGGDDSGAEAGQ